MVGPKTTSAEYRQTPVGQCFDALTSSHPEDTLVDPKAAETNLLASEFPFSGRYTPHASAHSGKCSDHLEQSIFSPDILKHMPETIVLPHTEVSQQQIKKDCLTTTLKIVRDGKKLPEKMQRGFHTYFLADTKGVGLKRGFSQFDNVAGPKRNGHQKFSGEMTARRALSYTLCMLKAGYAVPLGVSYLNNTVSTVLITGLWPMATSLSPQRMVCNSRSSHTMWASSKIVKLGMIAMWSFWWIPRVVSINRVLTINDPPFGAVRKSLRLACHLRLSRCCQRPSNFLGDLPILTMRRHCG